MRHDPLEVLEGAIICSSMGSFPSKGPGAVIRALPADRRAALAELKSKDLDSVRLPCLGWDWPAPPPYRGPRE